MDMNKIIIVQSIVFSIFLSLPAFSENATATQPAASPASQPATKPSPEALKVMAELAVHPKLLLTNNAGSAHAKFSYAIVLSPPKRLTLEQAIAYIDDTELVEVTPNFIRLRKVHLDPNARKRASRQVANG